MSAHTRSRRSASRAAVPCCSLSRLTLALASVWGLAGGLFGGVAWANPTGAQAVAGSVQLQSQGNHLQVTTQNAPGSSHSVIQWQGFSIPAGSSTYFQQPSAASTSINRVVGADPSLIFGTLGSNGRLVLVNPAGITVGAGAVVDTAGFVASALQMSEADALAARLRFGDGSPGGSITVDGHIVSRHGDLVLIASQIDTGTSALLQSPQGSTILAAGGKLELTGRGLEGIRFEVQAPANAVRQLGRIEGDAVGVFAGSLRHSGVITAHAVSTEGGRVVLKAAGDAIVQDQARITAQGLAQGAGGAPGGQVDILGDRVAVRDAAVIDVSGPAGGGQVRIGGDYQGKNASLPNARYTYFGPQASIRADATQAGDGGRVILWADQQTQAYGRISARGGAAGGDGGFVETSGKRRLDIGQAVVDTGAPMGRVGTWLLDPDFIFVANGGTETLGAVDQFGDIGGTLSIAPTTINAAVANVVLQANEDINIDNAINMTNANVGFTARAGGFLRVNSDITTRGGQVNLTAGDLGSLTTPSEGALYLNANIDTTGGGAVPGGANVSLTSRLSDVGGNSIVLGTAGGPTDGSINAGTTGGVTLFTNNIGINQLDGVITASQLIATADNDIVMNRANNIGTVSLIVNGPTASGGISFRNNRANYSLDGVSYAGSSGAVSIVGTGNVSIDGDVSASVSVAISQTGNISQGGGLIESTGGDVGLGGAALGATGPGNYLQVKAAGDVFLTANSGGIYVQQASGPLLTSTYNISAAGVGQEIKLAAAGTFGSSLQIDGFGGYNANTDDDDIGFYNIATNGSIQIGVGLTKTARSFDIGAEGGAGALTLNSGASTTLNASQGVFLSTAFGALTLAGELRNEALGASAGITVSSDSGNILGSTGTLRTTGGGDIEVTATNGSITGALSLTTVPATGAVGPGSVTVTASSAQSISLGTINTSALTNPGNSLDGFDAGDVEIVVGGADPLTAATLTLGAISANGGGGGAGLALDGGDGGDGGQVVLRRSLPGALAVNNLSVTASGGAGGNASNAGFDGGDGGNAGTVQVFASNGLLTLGGTAAQVVVSGGAGGNANPASGNGGDGGAAGTAYFGDIGNTSNAQGLAFNTATTVQAQGGTGGTALGGTAGITEIAGNLWLTAGTGGISQTAAINTGSQVGLVLDVGNSNVVLNNASNIFGTVHGGSGGGIEVRGLAGVNSSNLSAVQNITLSNTLGALQIDGDVVASGATSSVTLNGGGGGVTVQGSQVKGGSGGVSISATGGGVHLLGGVVEASGNVTLVGSGNSVVVDGSRVQSTGGNVSIAGTPISAGAPAVEVRSTGSAPSSVLAANTLQMSGGAVWIQASDASVRVEGNVVNISTGGDGLLVSGSDTVANASAKLLASDQMTLTLGSDLSIEGGAAANAFALVGGTAGSSSVSITTGFVNLLGGTGAGSYAGLMKVGGDLSTSATLNLVPDLSTGGGVLVAANNFASLNTNPVGATPVLYAALSVDGNTGVVSDAGSPFAVTGIVAGGGVALPPVVPVQPTRGDGTADINQSLLALLLQGLLTPLNPVQPGPGDGTAQNRDDVVAEAEVCR